MSRKNALKSLGFLPLFVSFSRVHGTSLGYGKEVWPVMRYTIARPKVPLEYENMQAF